MRGYLVGASVFRQAFLATEWLIVLKPDRQRSKHHDMYILHLNLSSGRTRARYFVHTSHDGTRAVKLKLYRYSKSLSQAHNGYKLRVHFDLQPQEMRPATEDS